MILHTNNVDTKLDMCVNLSHHTNIVTTFRGNNYDTEDIYLKICDNTEVQRVVLQTKKGY